MKIMNLCDNIDYIPTVAKWIYNEFIFGIKDDVSYEDIIESINICYKQELPVRLIALIDDKCVGTVSLVENDLECRNYLPWLAALYVDENHRNQGIGECLINALIDIAKELRYRKLYLRTEHASGYYRKLNWDFIETCDDKYDLKPDVFSYDLK